MQLSTVSVSESVTEMVRQFIVDGALPDGQRINEVHLSRELGISRTPLREGLGQLVSDGIVTKAPRRGFFVTPMTLSEFQQLYAIRPLLDPEALKLGGLPDQSCLDELDTLNRKLVATRKPSTAIDLDDVWHMKLLEHCPNRVLVGLIQQLIVRTRRYEHALFRETRNVWNASNEHDQIVAALRDKNLKSACRVLRQNMQSGYAPIYEWLSARTRQVDL
ncbi:MAG: GntR family transcriptional regulator [Woeseiaceae bacterium]